jgi:para-nitrobenzyl esterase
MTDFDHALVWVKQGKLQGIVENEVKVFRGIPYAAPPLGKLRFRAPEDPGSWRGVRDASRYGAASIQSSAMADSKIVKVFSQYEEDCLYLNVWSTAPSPDAKCPVFMWIHGGGLVAGSGVESVCQGETLSKNTGVVVVTINYRLGLFGFFGHSKLTGETDKHACGNYGLLDMRKAAMWIKDNIAAFGGDQDNVTIGGQSGGAAACGAILASPLMEGLFQHICIESGPIYWGFMQGIPREQLERSGMEFMKLAGCKTIDELREKDAWELYDIFQNNKLFMTFNLSIDGYFLPEDIRDIMENGKFNDVDVMIGNCSQEFPVSGKEGVELSKYNEYLKNTFSENLDNMKKWYPAATAQEAAKCCASISSDVMLIGAVRIAQLCAKYGRRAYVFLNTKETENEEGKLFGCAHCGEMPYLFGKINTGGRNPFAFYGWQAKDYNFMKQIMGYWSNFTTNGNPNGKGLIEWPTYDKDFKVMVLGNESHLMDQEFAKETLGYYMEQLMKDIYGSSLKFNYKLPFVEF